MGHRAINLRWDSRFIADGLTSMNHETLSLFWLELDLL